LRLTPAIASLDIYFNEWNEDLNVSLGETGAFISEGQKQRVCIARALYKDAETLVLDEATSALDDLNEKGIQKSIKKLLNKNYTILIIAHKKSFLSICDNIYELQKGILTKIE
jgi:ABC-type multidrug transport system fused ATPase/permease subunit